jgi:hypothetical protein
VKRTVGLSGHRACSPWGSNNVKEKLKIRAESELQNTATREAVSENLVRKETRASSDSENLSFTQKSEFLRKYSEFTQSF